MKEFCTYQVFNFWWFISWKITITAQLDMSTIECCFGNNQVILLCSSNMHQKEKNVFCRVHVGYVFLWQLYLSHLHKNIFSLQQSRNEPNDIWNHRRLDCLLNHLFRHRSNETSKNCITGLCKRNSPVTAEFPTQRSSNVENVSIWWCHHMKWNWFLRLFVLLISSTKP